MSDMVFPSAGTRGLTTRVRLSLAAMALVVALVPQASSAYTITCVNGYTSFLCKDGTKSICTSGGQQFDCPEANGEKQCAKHGGLAAILNDPITAVADYQGLFDLRSLQCRNCGVGQTLPIVFATWLGTCGDFAMMTCSEMDPNCASKQNTFKTFCSTQRAVFTSVWHIEFPPQYACSSSTSPTK